MKFLTLALALAGAANAHTMLSEIYINGESQGDATCIRTPKEGDTATSPVAGLTSPDMACGKDGATAAAYTCPASGSSKITFEFRQWPDARQEGSIDPSHRGPCAVYVKKVDDIMTTPAAGEGWFKIWDQGLDENGEWCVDKLIANKGLLTVELPSGLPAGYYLVRPEVVALHQAVSLHDPQYYVGCAQIYIQDGPSGTLNIPSENAVSIPGYIDGSEVGNNWNLYDSAQNPSGGYPIPGPKVWSPTGTSSGAKALSAKDIEGAIPSNCLVKNANWCGVPLETYSTQTGCWAQVDACYAQGEKCFDSAPPTGAKNCEAWNAGMCKVIEASCRSGNFNGPPENQIAESTTPAPGPIPAAVNLNLLGGSSSSSNDAPVSSAAASKTSAAPVVASSAPAEYAAEDPVSSAPSPTVAPTSAAPVQPAPASSTAAAPAPSTSNGVKISTDGKCGGDNGTCSGSSFGLCCSPMGTCGSSMRHCGCGCDNAFGLCVEKYQKKGKSN
ncbi:endoglucanase b [Colletotrichum karsti]|uniref:lytic cellulose monooxygenase (C4-dehydrogenating) n=1 Tax=Colletotrichum karsti TaxID=1095194 RepID=A0A9P6IFB9_9PEZI|nr:endoglucanase b [Colletotrichum karsti]KAF9881778.1 endoglucanase b [Colletotrichum karsti]